MNKHTATIIADLSSHLLVRARDEFEEVEFVESAKLFLEIANTLNEEGGEAIVKEAIVKGGIAKAMELHQKFGFSKPILASLIGISKYELDRRSKALTITFPNKNKSLTDRYCALLHLALNHDAPWYSTLYIERLTLDSLTSCLNSNYETKKSFDWWYTAKLLYQASNDGYIQISNPHSSNDGYIQISDPHRDLYTIEVQEKLKVLTSCEYFQKRITLIDD